MLEIAVLGLLNESPMHGYELRKRLATLLGAFRAFSYGSPYPTPPRVAQGRRDTGERSTHPPARAKEPLADLLAEVDPDAFDDEGFGARLAFFAQTRADIRLQILEGRRRRVEEQREGMKSTMARTGERFDRYTRQLHEHGLESVNREVRWLTALIEHERSDAPDGAEH